MKTESQIDALKTAAQNKSSETFKRFLEALDIMQKDDIPINVESVAKFANVSKRWIYNNPDLVEQIKNIKKENKNNRLMRDQAIKLSAKEREIQVLAKQIKLLRQQNEELKQQLEIAYAALYNKSN